MERSKEQWIDKALNSLDGLQPAIAPAGMYGNMMQHLQADRLRIVPDAVSKATIYRAAAAILLIVTMNVFTCVVFGKNVSREKQLQSFAKEYSITDNSDGLLNI
jgi:hypothetical protein